MTFEQAMEKGYLNLTEEEAEKIIAALFDEDDPGARLDASVALLGTFIPQEKMVMVLDLANVVLDANEEIEFTGGFEDDD